MFKTNYNKEFKLWSGRSNPNLYNSKISIAQALLRACKTHGPKIAQINEDTGIQMTYNNIRMKSIRAAQNLLKRGYTSRVVFGVLAKNSHNVAPIILASISVGSPVNTLDPSFGKTELTHMLKITKPGLMFCDPEYVDLVTQCLSELNNSAKIFTFGGKNSGTESVDSLFEETGDEVNFQPVRVDGENDTAAIVWSSGTTALPKGVCLSHAALLNTITEFDVVDSTDVLLCFSSLYLLSGWYVLLLGMLNGATRIISTKTFNAELQLELIEKYKVTFAWNAPHQAILMSKSERFDKADLSSLKFLLIIGSKTPLHVINALNAKMSFGQSHTSYGLSELVGTVTCNVGEKDSVGQVLGCYTIKIIDDAGNRCGIGENGEICIKPNDNFIGYYGNEDATKAAHDEEGFFLTADIGHFDELGNLYIVDRKKDMIKYCGFQVSPSEIESYLTKSSKISAACVIGVADEVAIELPAAFIIRSKDSNITEKDVYDSVAEHFADHCKLRGGIYFVETLPMTPSGKMLRRNLREKFFDLNNKQR